MKFLVITRDHNLAEEARKGFHPSDEVVMEEDWLRALDSCAGVDLIFVDMVATLDQPHRVAGYEHFAEVKMAHPIAGDIPLVLISPEPEYEMDFIAGFPEFVLANVRRPVDYRIFRRASTWV